MATVNELIEEILAEYELRFISDQPIPEHEERRLPRPLRQQRSFTDLDDQVLPSVRLPADQWVKILNDAKDEFEVDGASAIFSSWKRMTHLTLVTSRSPTACMQKLVGWP